MPCEIFIDTDRRLVISRGTGNFRYADFLEHKENLGANRRFSPDFDHLVDFRKFEVVDLIPAEVQAMGMQSIFAEPSRHALVVSSDLQFGFGRMFASFREMYHGQTTMVFRDMEKATAWLGLAQNYDPSRLDEPT